MSHFAPLVSRSRANANGPPYEEIVRPGDLRRYSDDLSALGAFFKPDHMADNFISRELAR